MRKAVAASVIGLVVLLGAGLVAPISADGVSSLGKGLVPSFSAFSDADEVSVRLRSRSARVLTLPGVGRISESDIQAPRDSTGFPGDHIRVPRRSTRVPDQEIQAPRVASPREDVIQAPRG